MDGVDLNRDGTVPTGDHIYRFVHTIARTIRPCTYSKEGPQVNTIRGILNTLNAVLTETYEDFKVTPFMAKRLDLLLNKLVKDGVLMSGRWRKPNRAGFQSVLRLTDAWMSTALTDGVVVWDIVISR